MVGGWAGCRGVWVAVDFFCWEVGTFPFLPPPFPPLFSAFHQQITPRPLPLPIAIAIAIAAAKPTAKPPPPNSSALLPNYYPTSSSIMPSSSDAPRSPVPPPAAAVAAAALSDSPPTIPMEDADDQPSSKKPRKIISTSSNITDDDDRIQRAALMIIKNPILTVPQVRGFRFQMMISRHYFGFAAALALLLTPYETTSASIYLTLSSLTHTHL